MEGLKVDARAIVGRLTHEDDKYIMPLQAADMLAWHVRRAGELRHSGETRYAHERLRSRMAARANITAGTLREIARRMTAVPHVQLTRGKSGSVRKAFRDNPAGALALATRNTNPSTRTRLRRFLARLMP